MADVLRFGDVELRPGERQLRVRGVAVALGGRAFDLLVALAREPDRVIGKNQLLDLVWPGLVVEENNLQVQVNALRKVLGPQAIRTVPGRGYQLAIGSSGSADRSPVAALSRGARPAVADAAPGNLVEPAPHIIGREAELADLVAQVEAHRLVTIVGTAGVGKTLLALVAGNRLQGRWGDGVWFVPLGALNDAAQIPHAVARALRLPGAEANPTLDGVVAAMEGQWLLLILDNAEHLVEGVATLASALVQRTPGVRVLVTSQELLNVGDEKIFKLGPLRVTPDASGAAAGDVSEALRLFADRAQRVDPRFALDAANAGVVAEICRRLDGLPLAIELAAARVRMLGVNGVLDHLDERFRLLTGGARTAMRRHQTLRAAFDWSHGLLVPGEQAVFRRLGVFSGGFTLELAQEVARDDALDEWAVLDALGGLCDKSLVAVSGTGSPRYAMLETARAFALEKLAGAGETRALTERHARVLLAHVERLHAMRFSEAGSLGETAYAEAVMAEADNLRAALGWAHGRDGDAGVGTGLIGAAAEAMMLNGATAEALDLLGRTIERRPEAAGRERATRFWATLVNVALDRGFDVATLERAMVEAEQGCRELGWKRTLFRTLLNKAWRMIRQRKLDAADAMLAEATSIEDPQWPAWLRSDRRNVEAELANYRGDYDRSLTLQRSIAAMLDVDERRRRARTVLNTAAVLNYQGAFAEAARDLGALIEDGRRPGRRGHLGWAYAHLLLALLELGRDDEANRRLNEALPLWRADATLPLGQVTVPRLAVAQGQVALAGELLAMRDPFWPRAPLSERFDAKTRRLLSTIAPEALDQPPTPYDADRLLAMYRAVADGKPSVVIKPTLRSR